LKAELKSPINNPKRFVPFATVGGKPSKIIIGKLRALAPPAKLFIKLTTRPSEKSIATLKREKSIKTAISI